MLPDTKFDDAVDYLWNKFGPRAIVELIMARVAWNGGHASLDEQPVIGETANHLQEAIKGFQKWEKIVEGHEIRKPLKRPY